MCIGVGLLAQHLHERRHRQVSDDGIDADDDTTDDGVVADDVVDATPVGTAAQQPS
jgi:hypothetical protein